MTPVDVEGVEGGVCVGLLRHLVEAERGECVGEVLHADWWARRRVGVSEGIEGSSVELEVVSEQSGGSCDSRTVVPVWDGLVV